MRGFTWLVPMLALGGAPSAFGQAPEEPSEDPQAESRPSEQADARAGDQAVAEAGPEAQGQDLNVSEQELETFADIYIDLEETLSEFETELAQIETEQQAQDLQARMQRETSEKIEERGWSPERYNRVIQAVNADPMLLQRALELIEERS